MCCKHYCYAVFGLGFASLESCRLRRFLCSHLFESRDCRAAMVVRTIRKSKENLPYKRQSVVNFFCVAEYGKCNLAGIIVAEKRDDNQKKIAYTVELYGIEGRQLV